MVEVRVDRGVYKDLDSALLLKMTHLFMSRSVADDVDLDSLQQRVELINNIVNKVLSEGVYSDSEKQSYAQAVLLDYDRAQKEHEIGEHAYVDERSSARGRELHNRSNPDRE